MSGSLIKIPWVFVRYFANSAKKCARSNAKTQLLLLNSSDFSVVRTEQNSSVVRNLKLWGHRYLCRGSLKFWPKLICITSRLSQRFWALLLLNIWTKVKSDPWFINTTRAIRQHCRKVECRRKIDKLHVSQGILRDCLFEFQKLIKSQCLSNLISPSWNQPIMLFTAIQSAINPSMFWKMLHNLPVMIFWITLLTKLTLWSGFFDQFELVSLPQFSR